MRRGEGLTLTAIWMLFIRLLEVSCKLESSVTTLSAPET